MTEAINSLTTPEAAKVYASYRIVTHPLYPPSANVNSPGKQPVLTRWQQIYQPLTMEEIYSEFSENNNIGIVCGRYSDIAVIDIDYYVKGIWDNILKGTDISKWIKQDHKSKTWHWIFKYCSELKAGQYKALGFDILSDDLVMDKKTEQRYVAGDNCVCSPSIHPDGNKYQITGDITQRPEIPGGVIIRLNNVLQLHSEIKKKILPKCRRVFRDLWNALFEDKESDLYRDSSIFRGTFENRKRCLHFCAELKANGAEDKHLMLFCMLAFGNFFDRAQSERELNYVEAEKPATNETIRNDLFLSQYYKESQAKKEITQTGEESRNNVVFYKELTREEIQAQKELFRDRRLSLMLSPDHFVCIYCDWLSDLTDGYREYMEMGALWLISSFCAGKVEVRLKQENVKPNIYAMLFGRSTTSRKTTIVNRTRQIYENVTGELLPNEDFSIQGYLESLDKNPVQNHVRDEAAGFLAIIHKQYNEGYNEFECAVYDGQNFRKTLASKGQKEPKIFNIKNPYVTKLSATVFDNYLRYTVFEDFLSGREYRTLFAFPFYNKPSKPLGVETKEDIKNWTYVLGRAKEIYLYIKQRDKVIFSFAPDALEYYSKVTSSLEEQADKKDNGILSSVVGRSQIHILKLAMLIELGKQQISTTLTRESIEIAAKAVIEYFIPTIMNIIEQLQEDAKNNQVEKVVLVLRRNGGAVQHSKALHDSKLKSKDFNDVIDTLIESETIERVIELDTKKIHYILKENKEKLDLSNFEILSIPQIPPVLLFSHDKEDIENLENLKNINKFDLTYYDDTKNKQNKESLSCEIKHYKYNSILPILSDTNILRESENSENWENRENSQSTQKSNNFSITQEGETTKQSCDISFSSPADYMQDTLLIRDLTNFAKTYYHFVVENLDDFIENFCTRNPGYKQNPGFSIVAEYSKILKSRGWST